MSHWRGERGGANKETDRDIGTKGSLPNRLSSKKILRGEPVRRETEIEKDRERQRETERERESLCLLFLFQFIHRFP